ncbi:MAG TPA: hypothetical protein VHY30_00050 [Verrucomicrobiae bacterium]|jgi:hypothetical protein|nr:hypothetical protein [Verrucomicrobiae bacterium]
MKTQKIVSFVIYLIAAVILGIVALQRMMLGVWGVSVSPFNYVAVLASLVLFFGAIICLINFGKGRIICVAALAALGTFYVPAIVSIVPEYGATIPPFFYFIFLGYFAALAFALFFPTRWKLSFPLYLTVLVITAAIIRATYAHRVEAGEFARPSIAFFYWTQSDSPLEIKGDNLNWINAQTKDLLEKNQVHGQLKLANVDVHSSTQNRIIVLMQRQITSTKQIFYPRNGTIIYAFNGTNWITFPKDAPMYSGFATLEPGDSQTEYSRKDSGGIEGTFPFQWSKK